jgi:hypothetical protein
VKLPESVPPDSRLALYLRCRTAIDAQHDTSSGVREDDREMEGNTMSESRPVPCPDVQPGSLERTVDRDDRLTAIPVETEADAAPASDDDEASELERMMIRLGGNGF